MKNFEYFEKELKEIAENGDVIAIVNDKPCDCSVLAACCDCKRSRLNNINHKSCSESTLVTWLLNEHVEE